MGDNYYGLAVFVKVNENVHYIVCGVFVKRRCRFIGKYYIRAVDNGSCKRNTLFLTSRKLFYGLFQKIGYKHIFRRLGYQLFHHFVFYGRVEDKRIRYIFIYRFIAQKSEILQYKAYFFVSYLRYCVGGILADLIFAQKIFTFSLRVKATEDMKHSGFSRA